jgi:hypothetical protein
VRAAAFIGATKKRRRAPTATPGDPIVYGADPTLAYPTTADYTVTTTGQMATALNNVAANGGGTIMVRGGTYREQWDLTSRNYGGGVFIHRYGTEEVIVSGADVVTGWVACDAGDATLLGAAWANCYKTTVPTASLADANVTPHHFNLHEAGVMATLAQDSLVALDPRYIGDHSKYHISDSFVLNGSSQVVGIVDASVIPAYTSAQLLNMRVALYHSPVAVDEYPITAYDGVNTITISTDATSGSLANPQSGEHSYALQNALPNIQAGQWGYNKTASGGSFTVYLWPSNPANLTSGIEISKRFRCLYLGVSNPGTITGPMRVEGIIFEKSGGYGLSAGSPVAHSQSGAASNTRMAGLTMRHCTARNWYSPPNKNYGGIYLKNIDYCYIENNDVHDGCNAFGIYMLCASHSQVNYNYLHDLGHAGVRWYGGGFNSTTETFPIISYNVRATYNSFLRCGRAAHANLMNFYEGCDLVLIYGNKWEDTAGFLTWQKASNILIAMNQIPIDLYDTASPRAVQDQNDGVTSSITGLPVPFKGEPDVSANARVYFWNNQTLPRPDAPTTWKNSLSLGNNDSNQKTAFYNSIIHGGGVPTSIASLLIEEKNNLYTAFTTGYTQNAGTIDATDWSDTTLSHTYVDVNNADYTYVAGGPAGHVGKDMSTFISTVAQVWFPGFDFSRDMYGNTINWANPFIGPYEPGFRI